MSEEQAYARMREKAMRNNQKLAELAVTLIDAADAARENGRARARNDTRS